MTCYGCSLLGDVTHSSQNGQQNLENMSKILPHQLEPEFSSGEEDNEEVFSESEEEENDSSAHSKFQGLSCDFLYACYTA